MISRVPIADSAGAITGFGLVLVILLIVGAVAVLVGRSRKHAAESEPVASASAPPMIEVEPNVGGMGLAVAAAILGIVSVFLPALESSAFSRIEKNTMIQSGTGWLVLGCAVGILGAVYRVHSRRMTTWAVFVLGLVILGAAVYDGTGSRTELESVLSFGGESVVVKGTPAVGLYAAGAAGLIAAFAGLILAGHVTDSYRGAARETMTCPDCAETVLAAARVCKHCGHEFKPAGQGA